MSTRRRLLAAALTAGLVACARSEPEPAETPAAKTATAVGTVVGVDPPNGTITLQHGPIPEVGWPAMRMAFRASPELIAQVKEGDRVEAHLKLGGGGGAEITALRKN